MDRIDKLKEIIWVDIIVVPVLQRISKAITAMLYWVNDLDLFAYNENLLHANLYTVLYPSISPCPFMHFGWFFSGRRGKQRRKNNGKMESFLQKEEEAEIVGTNPDYN